MFCPSSPLEKFKTSTFSGRSSIRGYGTYVGISGGYPDPVDPRRVANVRDYQGFMASNGTLFANGRLTADQVLDGMSNTYLVGEQSGIMFNMDKGGEEDDLRSGGTSYGSFIGANQSGSPCRGCSGWESGYPRAYNVTTIRHKLNTRTATFAAGMYKDGPNLGVQSAHPGGGQMLYGDGSVRFVRDAVPFETFKSQAIRDDGVEAGVIAP